MQHIHLIGIGGTGISAIAVVLLEQGYQVTGSDIADSTYFREVTRRGAKTVLGHDPSLATQADVIVRSSAIKDDDPEVRAAQAAGIPVLKRTDFLPQLTAGKRTIAVAGSHGKTTTTAMIVCLLHNLAFDPSFILGAEIIDLHANARAGSSPYFIIEADEYDNMFLGLNPAVSVITNIEYDHPDCFPTPESYLEAFRQFLLRTQPSGTALLCADDPGVQKLLQGFEAKDFVLRTYGFAEKSHYHIASADWNGEEYTFTLTRQLPGEEPHNLGSFRLPMPGKHNVSNAAAALAVIDILGIPPKDAAEALAGFHGSERRMEVVLEQNGIVIINDYGHHPTQIAATLAALRQRYPQKKLWAIWEPHTYSRTEMLQDAYARSLQAADEVVITRIYAAREAEHNFDPSQIAAHIPGGKARYLPDFDTLADYVCKNLSGDDVIVVLSAGKGPQISALLQAHISSPKKEAQA
ncbi:MAG TPA: UDP-N-acetylmuramate--L-alanine ligase [Anaerolineaceae bacterium]|nr:UDP-N-acetylmuramate--L-alanine ligase [Anaerolineaceae bacterium]